MENDIRVLTREERLKAGSFVCDGVPYTVTLFNGEDMVNISSPSLYSNRQLYHVFLERGKTPEVIYDLLVNTLERPKEEVLADVPEIIEGAKFIENLPDYREYNMQRQLAEAKRLGFKQVEAICQKTLETMQRNKIREEQIARQIAENERLSELKYGNLPKEDKEMDDKEDIGEVVSVRYFEKEKPASSPSVTISNDGYIMNTDKQITYDNLHEYEQYIDSSNEGEMRNEGVGHSADEQYERKQKEEDRRGFFSSFFNKDKDKHKRNDEYER